MRLSAVMLLLGSAYAYSTKQHIANEVAALESLVGAMEEPSPNAIFAQMVERKEELQYLAANHPSHNKRYASELSTLASMVDLVEEQNFNQVLSLISARKDKLVKDLATLKEEGDEDENKDDGKKDDDNKKKDDDKKSDDSGDLEANFEKYQEKLTAFYESLPKDVEAVIKYKAELDKAAKALADANKAYEEKAGKPLTPMNPVYFKKYVELQKEKYPKTWEKLNPDAPKKEDDKKDDGKQDDPA